jgi:hypothetical protein
MCESSSVDLKQNKTKTKQMCEGLEEYLRLLVLLTKIKIGKPNQTHLFMVFASL